MTEAQIRALAKKYHFDVGCDNYGQLILFTNVKLTNYHNVIDTTGEDITDEHLINRLEPRRQQ